MILTGKVSSDPNISFSRRGSTWIFSVYRQNFSFPSLPRTINLPFYFREIEIVGNLLLKPSVNLSEPPANVRSAHGGTVCCTSDINCNMTWMYRKHINWIKVLKILQTEIQTKGIKRQVWKQLNTISSSNFTTFCV